MVTYEIDHSLTTLTRVDYGLFTFFSDVGGLVGLTYSIGTIINLILTLDGPETYVTADMLKTHDKKGSIHNMTSAV